MNRVYFAPVMQRSKVYLTRAQSRLIDELAIQSGISGIRLMENAGRSCVSRLMERSAKVVAVCCGIGNNGGDGFVIARRLAVEGITVKIFVCGDVNKMTGDALTNYKIADSLDLDIQQIDASMELQQIEHAISSINSQPVDWIVDCLLGTGATGNPRPPMDAVITAANNIQCNKMAVDVPSGLDCDTGVPAQPTFRADLTCTFVAKKVGFKNALAAPFLGTVQSVSISIPEEIVEQVLETTES